MEDNKIYIILELEFSKEAITLSDMEDGTSFTDSDIINNDKEICKLNSKIGTLASIDDIINYYKVNWEGNIWQFNKILPSLK